MADFNWKPDFVFEETPEFHTLLTQFENGAEQRRAKWSSPRRKWRLVFRNRYKSEYEAIRDFFIEKMGAYGSFTWDNPNDGNTYTVRFEEDGITFSNKAYDVYDFEFGFVEVKV